MAAPKAPLLGGAKKDVTLDEAVFGADVKPHLVHEVVRAEFAERRQGTHSAKSRGLVSGGRAKPWRQKGTGRARQGTIRAPQFEGGGHAFAKTPRTFTQKVNRKVVKAAFRSALASHAQAGTVAVLDPSAFTEPSTKQAKALFEASGLATPTVLVLTEDDVVAGRSFRNLEGIAIVEPDELEISAIVWARSLLVSEGALPLVETRAR